MAELSDGEPLVLVASIDEAYVMPLAVMVRSALENLRPGVGVKLFVLEDGTRPESRRRAEASWAEFPIEVEWLTPDPSTIERCVQDRGYAGVPATYNRLLLAEMLPSEVRKAIYLDADVIVTGDLHPLWERDLSGHLALAVPDAYFELYHHARFAGFAFRDEDRPAATDRYFNAGVLVIDVDAWRREEVGRRALTIAERYRDALQFHDQDALNCVLAGRWGALSPAWNLHELFDVLMYWDCRQYPRSEVGEALRDPCVIHFIGPTKPWAAGCANVHASAFAAYHARTSWGDERLPEARPLDRLAERHGRLNWLFWRGVVHERDAKRRNSLVGMLWSRPWMLLTFPVWQATVWTSLAASRAWFWARRQACAASRDRLRAPVPS